MNKDGPLGFEAYFDGLAARLRALRTGGPVIGCSTDEIQEIREDRGGELSPAYEAFLKVMGRRAGVLWLAEEWFYPDILTARDSDIIWFANELELVLPPGNRCPIMVHSGYEFKWLGESQDHPEDPPVWQLLEGFDPPVKLLSERYSSYVEDQVAAWEDYVEGHPYFYFPRP